MFTFYLFLLFWGIPTIFTFPEHRRSAFENHPEFYDSSHPMINFHGPGPFDDYPYNTNPFYDNDDVWIWEVRNITEEDKPCEKPAKFKEESTAITSTSTSTTTTTTTFEFDYIPFKIPRDDSFEWRLFKDSKEALNSVNKIIDLIFHPKSEPEQNVSYDKVYNLSERNEQQLFIDELIEELFSPGQKQEQIVNNDKVANLSNNSEKEFNIDEMIDLIVSPRRARRDLNSNDWIWSLFAYSPFNAPGHDPLQWKLLQTILHNKSDNVILSPVLAKLDLTILSETTGIGSEAGREWDTILPDLESFSANRDLYKQILESLKKGNNFYDVFAATKVYIDQRFQPRQNFLEILSSHYNADLEKLDFKNIGQSAKIINDWGDNVTEGHLNYLVDAEGLRNSALIVINVIYFDGQWTVPFPDRNTEEHPFSVERSKQVKAKFMTQVQDFYYVNSPDIKAQLLRLPLKGFKFSMFLLLPHPETTLDDVLRGMNNDDLKKLQWLMNPTKVKVSIPKFQIDHTAHLKEFLQLLGLKTVFTTRASLIGLTGRNQQLPLSDIIQKTGLIVSEKGLTAYQATEAWNTDAINVRYGSTSNEFMANRPFAYFIEDETIGVLLLAGKVTDPTLDTVTW